MLSRIGRLPVAVPDGVSVEIDGSCVNVSGPKGSLSNVFSGDILISLEGNNIVAQRKDNSKRSRSLHGLTRALINNMVLGVTVGFEKKLEVNGVGYRVQMQGRNLVMNLGYSHPVVVSGNDDIDIKVEGQNVVIISGSDKQKVGQFAAEVRGKRPPEPYKGKGVKYADEHIMRKAGKAGKGSKG